MKKVMTIFLLVALAAVYACSLVACKPNGGYEEVEGKTNIRVATYNGGLGKEWLETAAKEFEKKYENKSFEEGKTGVAVHVEFCQSADLLINQSLKSNVYLTELFDYYTWVNDGKVADITDAVKGNLAEEFGEDKTIESKLDNQFVDFLTAKDGKYYALPFYDGFMGFVYDVDWFCKQGYFFKKGGGFTGDMTQLAEGPDGVVGTWDDGMPATYDDFTKLLDKIEGDGGTPLVYGSDATDYWQKALTSWWANYEGKQNMLANWKLQGTFDRVTAINGNNVTTDKFTLDASNVATSAKELQKQPGKYYALRFIDDVLCSKQTNYNSTLYLEAQSFIVNTGINQTNTKYSLLLDGAWWENEATLNDVFEDASAVDFNYNPADGDYKSTRRFAMMPVPRAYGQTTENYKQTLYSDNAAFAFVGSNTVGAQLDVSKLFMQYLHTDAQLSAFTAKTSIPRCLNYEIFDTDEAKMTYFGKYMMEMKAASDVVYPYSGTDYYLRNSGSFTLSNWGWKSRISGIVRESPFATIASSGGKVTAEDYFKGLYEAH